MFDHRLLRFDFGVQRVSEKDTDIGFDIADTKKGVLSYVIAPHRGFYKISVPTFLLYISYQKTPLSIEMH